VPPSHSLCLRRKQTIWPIEEKEEEGAVSTTIDMRKGDENNNKEINIKNALQLAGIRC
jgi:hypothetical protein